MVLLWSFPCHCRCCIAMAKSIRTSSLIVIFYKDYWHITMRGIACLDLKPCSKLKWIITREWFTLAERFILLALQHLHCTCPNKIRTSHTLNVVQKQHPRAQTASLHLRMSKSANESHRLLLNLGNWTTLNSLRTLKSMPYLPHNSRVSRSANTGDIRKTHLSQPNNSNNLHAKIEEPIVNPAWIVVWPVLGWLTPTIVPTVAHV